MRPHHLLCFFGFRGLGYSPAFVDNMTRLAGLFFSRGRASFELVLGPDDVCAACPHLKGKGCSNGSDAAVRARDRAVLGLLRLKTRSRLGATALRKRVLKCVSVEELRRVCTGCGWLARGYCEEGLARRPSQSNSLLTSLGTSFSK
ncbi:MAG: DUF1284 domain-containing protein [Elusimicrobiota bacterium]